MRIFFVACRGSFGDQAVHELYPKLLKRLDDSSDQVRVAVCATLEMFLQSAPKQCYRSVEMIAVIVMLKIISIIVSMIILMMTMIFVKILIRIMIVEFDCVLYRSINCISPHLLYCLAMSSNTNEQPTISPPTLSICFEVTTTDCICNPMSPFICLLILSYFI